MKKPNVKEASEDYGQYTFLQLCLCVYAIVAFFPFKAVLGVYICLTLFIMYMYVYVHM